MGPRALGSGVGTTETGVLEQEGWGDSDVSGRDQTYVSYIDRRVLYHLATGEAHTQKFTETLFVIARKMETPQMSFHELMDIQTVAHTCNSTVKVNKPLIHTIT